VQSEVEVEVVNWRIVAMGAAPEAPDLDHRGTPVAAARPSTRRVHLWQDDQQVATLPRAGLRENVTTVGPLVIEEAETTLIIPPGWNACLGALGCVIARRDT
jgi:N-methylhydantoinase A